MTKKNIVLILILAIFFSVMVISVWGKNPEPTGVVPATEIIFYDKDNEEVTEINNTQDHERIIPAIDKNESGVTYNFSLNIKPENTTDTKVNYYFTYGGGTMVEIIKDDSFVPAKNPSDPPIHSTVYYYSISFTYEEQNKNTKIDFEFNKVGGSTKHAYLLFRWKANEGDVM